MKGIGRMYNGANPTTARLSLKPRGQCLPSFHLRQLDSAALGCENPIYWSHTVEAEIQGSPWRGTQPIVRQPISAVPSPPPSPTQHWLKVWILSLVWYCSCHTLSPHRIGFRSGIPSCHSAIVAQTGVTILRHLLRTESPYPLLSPCHLTFHIQSPVILIPQF